MRELPSVRHRVGTALIGIAVIAGAVAYVHHIDWRTTLLVIGGAAPAMLTLAYGFHLLSLLAKSGVWWVCLRAVGTPTFATVARLTFLSAALNSLLVANSGEAGRVVLISRLSGLRGASAFATVALERLINVGGFVVVLLIVASLLPLPAPVQRAILGGMGLMAVVALCVVARRGRGRSLTRRSRSALPRFARVMRVQLARVLLAVQRIATARRMACASVLTLTDWTCQLASYHLVARAAHLPISLAGSVLALLAVNLGLVVRVTPGNVGIFELAYAAAAASQGAPAAAAVGVGMLIHLVQDVPTIVLGLVSGRTLRRRVNAMRATVMLTAPGMLPTSGMRSANSHLGEDLPAPGGTIS
ncbi:MAG TPA: lysylphosphatidylglycerol synthase transmembrane domain-containing protein [Gemmatimonadaceae bacterium]|nr:lysylphosphatidylglycerol synthase transmembrane domain-containing protein [Gemmatimonadaceae bacterium]